MAAQMMGAAMTGDPDHDFSAMMIPYHEGAIDMAKAVLFILNPALVVCRTFAFTSSRPTALRGAGRPRDPARSNPHDHPGGALAANDISGRIPGWEDH